MAKAVWAIMGIVGLKFRIFWAKIIYSIFDKSIMGVESSADGFRFPFCSTPSGLWGDGVPLLPRVSPAVIIVEALQASGIEIRRQMPDDRCRMTDDR